MTDKEIKRALECCGDEGELHWCTECPYYDKENDFCQEDLHRDALDLIIRQQAEIKEWKRVVETWQELHEKDKAEIERLTTIAKKMHSWIFTNSYDEEKAYAECGLTDEENTLLGYCGKIVFESKEMVGEKN